MVRNETREDSFGNKLIRISAFLFLFFLPIVYWVAYLAFIVLLFCFIWRHKFENLKLNYYVYGLLGIIILSAVFSPYKLVSINAVLLLLPCFIIYFIFTNIKIPEREILNAIIFSGIVIALWGIFQYITKFHLNFHDKILGIKITINLLPGTSTLGNENRFAKYLVLIIPLALSHILYEKSLKERIISFVFLPLGFVSLWITHCLGGILAAFIVVSAVLWLKDKRIGIGFLLLGIVFGALSYKKILLFTSTNSTEERLYYITHITPEIVKARPLLGYGWGTYNQAAPAYDETHKYAELHPHNVYAQFLCETGILGLIAFLLFIGSFLFLSIKYCKGAASGVPTLIRGGIVSISGLLLFGLTDRIFENHIYEIQVELLFFAIIGIVTGLVIHYKNSTEQSNPKNELGIRSSKA